MWPSIASHVTFHVIPQDTVPSGGDNDSIAITIPVVITSNTSGETILAHVCDSHASSPLPPTPFTHNSLFCLSCLSCFSFSCLCYASMLMNLSTNAFKTISLCFHYAFIVLQLLTQNLWRMHHWDLVSRDSQPCFSWFRSWLWERFDAWSLSVAI